MCYLITFAVPKPIELDQAAHSLAHKPFENRGGGHVYDPDWSVYALTAGGCSCDLVNLMVTDATQIAELEKLRAKYKKKGWSGAKIERALTDKIGATDPPPPPLRPDAAKLLSDVLHAQGRLDLLLHWHSGEFGSEPFETEEIVQMTWPERFELGQLRENIRYRFRK